MCSHMPTQLKVLNFRARKKSFWECFEIILIMGFLGDTMIIFPKLLNRLLFRTGPIKSRFSQSFATYSCGMFILF